MKNEYRRSPSEEREYQVTLMATHAVMSHVFSETSNIPSLADVEAKVKVFIDEHMSDVRSVLKAHDTSQANTELVRTVAGLLLGARQKLK
ncbi:MAG: hypothetical protein SGJ05_10960 [bacterium]|nr:hypothetical protein [bacterium]